MKRKVVGILVVTLFVISTFKLIPFPVKADVEKSDVIVALFVAAGAATAISWGLGTPLQLSILAHIAAIQASNHIDVSNFQMDHDYLTYVIPPDLSLTNSQTERINFSENLNQIYNEAINSVLTATSFCLALATTTNRYYTAKIEMDITGKKMQLENINLLLLKLRQAEVEAADKLVNFATVLISEGHDLIITKQQFTDFQNKTKSGGLPQEELDLFNYLFTKIDPILLKKFDFLDYCEDGIISVNFPYSDYKFSESAIDSSDFIIYTSQVIGPFPIEVVGGFWINVDKLELIAPYIALATLTMFAIVVTLLFVKRKTKR